METQTELKVITLLRAASLTADMETDHLKVLAAIANEVEFKEDEIIYHQERAGTAIYLITSGGVAIETKTAQGQPILFNTLGPGQFFGWAALFPEEREMARARATTPTQAIAFNARELWLACQVDHKLQYVIVRRAGKNMVNRVNAARQQLAKMINQP